jgi:hypothetical protein
MISVASTEMAKAETAKDTHRGGYNMDTDETHPAGLMVPRFQYGDTPDNNVHQGEKENSIVDDRQRSLDLSGIMSNESVYNNHNDNAKSHPRVAPASTVRHSCVELKRAISSHSIGAHGYYVYVNTSRHVQRQCGKPSSKEYYQ